MADHDADIPKEVQDAAQTAEKERAAQLYDQALGIICGALARLGIDHQALVATKLTNGDFIVSVMSPQGQKRPYARVDRKGVLTLLGDQIGPWKNPDPHPAETK